jgi:hypothetical protein
MSLVPAIAQKKHPLSTCKNAVSSKHFSGNIWYIQSRYCTSSALYAYINACTYHALVLNVILQFQISAKDLILWNQLPDKPFFVLQTVGQCFFQNQGEPWNSTDL